MKWKITVFKVEKQKKVFLTNAHKKLRYWLWVQ